MVTGFDILGHDKRLQRHWMHRMAAITIDGALVFTILGTIFLILDTDNILFIGLFSSKVFFLYSGISEAIFYNTFGKRIMGLRIRHLNGDKKIARIFVRNLPKIFWFIHLPVDMALGLAMRGDPRQRFFDRMVRTTVVHVDEPDFRDHKSSEE